MTNSSSPKLVVYSTVPPDHALAYLRYRAPAEQLGWTIIHGKEGENTIYPQLVEEANFVLIQRDFPRFLREYQQIITAARIKRVPILYDIDDAIIALPEDHPSRGVYVGCLENIILALLDADRIIVSSNVLAEIVYPFNTKVVVWPSVLPDSLWHIKTPSQPRREYPLRIGYMGSPTHHADLDVLQPVFQALLVEFGENLEFVFWGSVPPDVLRGKAGVRFYDEQQPYPMFTKAFYQAEADIWLAPLQDNLFNRCKSSIKFWEYSAIGGVGIYSRIAPYEAVVRHGENGFLASSTEEWLQYIRFLLQNPDTRFQVAQQAQQDLVKDGLLSLNILGWEQVFKTALSKSETIDQATTFQRAMHRMVTQIQIHSEEKEQRINQFIHQCRQLENQYSRLSEYIRILERRSIKLDELLHSRSWRLIQRLNKLRRFDFNPIEIPPPPKPPEASEKTSTSKSLQND